MNHFLLLLLTFTSITAFTVVPATVSMRKTVNRPRQISFMSSDAEVEAERLREKARQLKEEVAALSGTTVEEMEAASKVEEKVVINTSGDLYDDEVEAYKDPLSDSMRSKLMREASSGLDSEQKQTNVILYISIAVVILVALGGQGIFF